LAAKAYRHETSCPDPQEDLEQLSCSKHQALGYSVFGLCVRYEWH